MEKILKIDIENNSKERTTKRYEMYIKSLKEKQEAKQKKEMK